MPQVQEVNLTFESLAELDNGRIAALLKRHLSRRCSSATSRKPPRTA